MPPTANAVTLDVKVAGQSIDPAMAAQIVEVRVSDHLLLPDAMYLRIADPAHQFLESELLGIGAEVEILTGGPVATQSASIFRGQVAALEPEFTTTGTVLAVRAYDHSHVLHRTRRSETYQDVTPDDVAKKVAQRAGLQVGKVDSGGPTQPFIQQHNETDWAFLWRLASALDYEVVVADKKLNFQKADRSNETPLALRWTEGLTAFRPRVTGVQQFEEVVVRGWDPGAKRAIEARAKPVTDAKVGVQRDPAVKALGGGTLAVADRPVVTQAEADHLAGAFASRVGAGFIEAEGTAQGNPGLKAGKRVSIEGLGARFGGQLTVSSTQHVIRGGHGYQTHFTVSGRSTRSLVELMTPDSEDAWTSSVVVGVVTQNSDPEGLGRVRVNYPALGDSTEGWWARVVSPSAGDGDRGMVMLPQTGDEVLIAFEHGDVRRPYVLGAVFHGKGKPGSQVRKDGSFGMKSPNEIHIESGKGTFMKADTFEIDTKSQYTLDSKDQVIISGAQSVTVSSDQDATVQGKTGLSLTSPMTVTIEGDTQVEISAPQITIKADAMIQLSAPQVMVG